MTGDVGSASVLTTGRRFLVLVVAVVVLAAIVRATFFQPEADNEETAARNDVVDFLVADDGSQWAPVVPGLALRFPDDHGAHPEFRQEWWYFTGNLAAPSGRRFGFQLTFFRFAHDAFDDYRPSAWHHRQTWMAHFAISDIEGRQLIASQDYARGALELAGAAADPFRVWVNGWSVTSSEPAAAEGFGAHLAARAERIAVALDIETGDPPLLQGEEGYSIKDHDGRTASYYYSMPDLDARGNITIDDEVFQVSGRVWMDREWSTSVLSRDQSGWDWFALRLDSGARLMLFQVRDSGGANFHYAILVDPGGDTRRFDSSELSIEPTSWWTSDVSGARYPVSWRLNIPSARLDLVVTAAFDAQELDLDFRYWEGVVNITGSVDNDAVRGEGYLELTGY